MFIVLLLVTIKVLILGVDKCLYLIRTQHGAEKETNDLKTLKYHGVWMDNMNEYEFETSWSFRNFADKFNPLNGKKTHWGKNFRFFDIIIIWKLLKSWSRIWNKFWFSLHCIQHIIIFGVPQKRTASNVVPMPHWVWILLSIWLTIN